MSLRHERRRRLLAEEGESVEPIRLAGSGEDGASSIPAYTDDARAARGKAVASLVPLSRIAIGLTITLALALVGACLALDMAAGKIAPAVGEQAASVLRLDAPGSVDRWLASTLLGAAALTAVFIYSLRRHRSDDYHGRYRVWLWMAAAALVTSLLESSGLAVLAQAGCQIVSSWAHLRSDIVWPATIATLASGVGLRLFFEVRRSKSAVAGSSVAATLFLTAVAAYQRWPVPLRSDVAPLVARGSWLIGYVMVMTTFVLYARFVEFEITGGATLPSRPKRRKVKPTEGTSTEARPARKASLRLRTDLDPVEASPAAESTLRKPVNALKAAPTDSSANQSSSQGSSRAERRRMKQQRMAG